MPNLVEPCLLGYSKRPMRRQDYTGQRLGFFLFSCVLSLAFCGAGCKITLGFCENYESGLRAEQR